MGNKRKQQQQHPQTAAVIGNWSEVMKIRAYKSSSKTCIRYWKPTRGRRDFAEGSPNAATEMLPEVHWDLDSGSNSS